MRLNSRFFPSSLHGRLLVLLMATLGALLAFNLWSDYRAAGEYTQEAYDLALADTAVALAAHVQSRDQQLSFDLPLQAALTLSSNRFDDMYYLVRGPDGVRGGWKSGFAFRPVTSRARSRLLRWAVSGRAGARRSLSFPDATRRSHGQGRGDDAQTRPAHATLCQRRHAPGHAPGGGNACPRACRRAPGPQTLWGACVPTSNSAHRETSGPCRRLGSRARYGRSCKLSTASSSCSSPLPRRSRVSWRTLRISCARRWPVYRRSSKSPRKSTTRNASETALNAVLDGVRRTAHLANQLLTLARAQPPASLAQGMQTPWT